MKKLVLFLFLFPLLIVCQPLTTGQGIITHWTDAAFAGPGGGYAFHIFDTENNLTAPLGVGGWATAFYTPDDPVAYNSWKGENMGDVFGIAIDSDKNAYFTTTKAIASGSISTSTGSAGDGGVYIMDGNTWLVTPFIYTGNGANEIPNSGVGLGNVCHDPWHNQLFITNFEDGKIYRFDMSGNLLSTHDPFEIDDGSDGFAGLGEVSWGIELYGTNAANVKLYFAVWNNLENASIWSINLDLDGEFSGTEELCFQLPPLSGSYPVSDITFDSFGNMYLAEKCNSYAGDGYTITSGAHNSRAFQYQEIDGIWTETQQYLVGAYGVGDNTTGGVAIGNKNTEDGYECDQLLWASGDCMGTPCSIYGVAGIPVDGNADIGADASSIYIDVPDTPMDKTAFGDVEIWSLCEGCTDEVACNYDWWAFLDDKSCIYPEPFSVDGIINNVSCFEGGDGSIVLDLTGNSTYSFEWSNGETTQNIFNLNPGEYIVSIYDINCESNGSEEYVFNISEPDILIISENHSNYNGFGVSCNGDANGFIDLTVTGGTGEYIYEWSNGETSEDITDLEAGTYSVLVTDENNCPISIEVEITEPEELDITEIHSNYNGFGVSCSGLTDGFIDVTVTGGVEPYIYEWDGINSFFSMTEDVSNLAPGLYSLNLFDANMCQLILEVEITEPEELDIAELHSDYTNYGVSCNGLTDGFIDVTVTGGTGVYTYVWSNGEITEDIFNLGAGIYSVIATDENNCPISIEVEITEPEEMIVSETHSNYNGFGVSCNGDTNGFIDITVSGGTGIYTYEWSSGQIIEDISDLGAGTYSVIVTDENNCPTSIEVEITESEELDITAIYSNYNGFGVSCNGDTDGFIDIMITGGTGTYTYEWSNGQISEDISDLGAGTYSVIVTDENNCPISTEIEITEPEEMIVSETHSNYNGFGVSCNEGEDGFIDITISGGTGIYIYEWSNGQITEDISGLEANAYSVVIIDQNGCSTTLEQTLNEPDPITIPYNTQISDCGFNNGSFEVMPSGGVPPYSFLWSNGQVTPNIYNLNPDNYSVVITDLNGCAATVSDNILETEPAPVIIPPQNINCDLSTTLQVYTDDTVSGPWEALNNIPGIYFNHPDSTFTSVTVPDYGTYSFQYFACNNYDTIHVTFACPLIIPNVITPNGDENNDLFIIENLNWSTHSQSNLTIYNRWGKVVFSDPFYGLNNQWWDGRVSYSHKANSLFSLEEYYDNESGFVNDGVYYYVLEVLVRGNIVLEKHVGFVHIFENP